ncbi:MAG: hypothetical protein HYZ27_00195, partial [Deltaproteobacteria bacterium]|nr:hypothetical protein [Deltaproteobacteria bacterium]
MKVVTLCLVALAVPARAAELTYKWKAGSTYRFETESNDSVTMSGMGMNQQLDFVTRGRFALKINKVNAKGKATGVLFVEAFAVQTKDGQKVAGLESIPKEELKSQVEVDAKGDFQFKEVIYVVVDDDGGNLLVSGSAGPNSVSGTGRAGDQEVTVYAKFDPKTGALSAGYNTKTIAKKTKKVAVTQDKPKVDVLPTMFMELLRLPDGDVAAGGEMNMDMAAAGMSGDLSATMKVQEMTAERAKLKLLIKSSAKAEVPAEDAQDDEAE